MLARLQRRVLAVLAALALAWAVLAWRAGHPVIAMGGALAIAVGYTLVLAIEFTLLTCLHGEDETARAGPLTLLRAWWAECVVALQVFGWRQPFRSRAWPDVPGRSGQRGVVFVHGYVCNRGVWNPWLERCAAEGRPCIAIDLEPVFSPLDAYVPLVEQAVSRLERQTGLAPLLVCHSMGGLVARAWLATAPDADLRVQHVVTIGTPHRGTWLARLSRTANSLHMRQACEWLTQLSQRELPARARLFTCFYGHADNIVFPPLAAVLEGAQRRHLPATPHVAMAYHPEVFATVFEWLDKADARPAAASVPMTTP